MTIDREAAMKMADDFNSVDRPWGCFFEGFGGGNALVFFMGRFRQARPIVPPHGVRGHGDSMWDEIRIPGDSGMSLEELQDFCAIVGDTLEDCYETLSELA